MRRLFGLVGAVLLLAACGAGRRPANAASTPGETPPTTAAASAPPATRTPATTHPAIAASCTSTQLAVTADGINGAGGHVVSYYRFTNVSRTVCLLAGYPRLVAAEIGYPAVVAADGTFFGDGGPPGNIAPDGHGSLLVEYDDFCGADPGGFPQLTYDHATVMLPGGGNLVLPDASFPVVCGLRVAAFSVPPVPSPSDT